MCYDRSIESSMEEDPIKDLATRAFQKRVLDEFAAVRREQAATHQDITELRSEIVELRSDVTEIRNQQSAMAKNIAALDQRLGTLEELVDKRLKETRPIWEGVQEQVQRLLERFEAVILEFSELRGDVRIHGRRIGALERRVLG